MNSEEQQNYTDTDSDWETEDDGRDSDYEAEGDLKKDGSNTKSEQQPDVDFLFEWGTEDDTEEKTNFSSINNTLACHQPFVFLVLPCTGSPSSVSGESSDGGTNGAGCL